MRVRNVVVAATLLLAIQSGGCGGGVTGPVAPPAPPPLPPPPPSPVRSIDFVELTPAAARIPPGSTVQFSAVYRWSDGSTSAASVVFAGTGGEISPEGAYLAGPTAGLFNVVAVDQTSGMADTSDVAIDSATAGYQTEYSDDFSRYPNDAALRGAYSGRGRRIWNFGGIDWGTINLIPDPVFGQALRTTQRRQDPYYDLVGAPDGMPGAVQRTEIRFTRGAMPALWVRFYVRFDVPEGHPYGWRTKSPNDPSPFGGAYKIFFLHWADPYSERGAIVFNNTYRLDAQFYVAGLAKVHEGPVPGSGSPQGLSAGDGTEWRDGQWYEMIYLYRRMGGNLSRTGAWIRRYSGHGAVDPGPYRWWMVETEFAGPPPLASRIELGGNKNHGNEFDQYVIWGPWEVVDADRFGNPFGVPMF